MQLDFIIIFGTRWHFRRVRDGWDGVLNCPECGRPERFEEHEAFKAFTLYWFPLYRTEDGGRIVVCSRCKGRFHPPPELGGEAFVPAEWSV